jgi:hypothetical protein
MLQRSQRIRKTGSKLPESFLALSAAAIAAFYGMMGVILLSFPKVFVGLSPRACLLFGLLLILYSVFRGYRAYKQWQQIQS